MTFDCLQTRAGKEFEIPLIVSEQFPEKLGKTVPDLDISHAAAIISKTQFSMLVPELENKIKTIYGEKPCDVVLYGLEVKLTTLVDIYENL